jgi:hypothetical protein
MKPAYLLIVLLAVGAVWWFAGHPGYETERERVARAEVEQQAAEAAKARLYRWHDRNGVTQLTSTPPPKGRKYEVVDMDKLANDNLIPMSSAINPPPPSTAKAAAK